MSDLLRYKYDPWIRESCNKGAPPPDVIHVFTHDLFIEIDHFVESVFLRRTDEIDELWIDTDCLSPGRAIWGIPDGSDEVTAKLLFAELTYIRSKFAWPTGLTRSGLLNTMHYEDIIESVKTELDAVANVTASKRTLIVRTAAALGLDPDPESRRTGLWRARCPGTNHGLTLNSDLDEFYCGHCRKSGDTLALERFARKREGV